MLDVNLGTVAVTGLVTSAMQLATWFLFRRRIEESDKKTGAVHAELDRLKKKEIEDLQQAQRDAAKSRKAIHTKIEKECVAVEACTREHKHADDRIAAMEKKLSDTNLILSAVESQTAGMDGKLTLICKNMNITIG